MKRLALAASCCVLAFGGAARAQVTSVSGSSSTFVNLGQASGTYTNSGPGMDSYGTSGAAFYSSYSSTPSLIQFESGAAARGNYVSTSSSSSVAITIQNGGSTTVDPTLKSDITAAGLGLYLADTSGPCGGSGLFTGGDSYGGCGQTTGGQTFDNLYATGDIGQPVAGAEFEFKVTADGATVYDFTGIEQLTVGDGDFLVLNPLQLSDDSVLQGLTEITPGAAGSADGYMWNNSAIDIALGAALAPGATRDIVYTSTVTTFSYLNCTDTDSSVCLVPYASFGDPIGRGGGVSGAAPVFGAATDLGTVFDGSADGIEYVDDWAPVSFATPTFADGVLSFGAVPEPATWMSLILGFAALGGMLRANRRRAALA